MTKHHGIALMKASPLPVPPSQESCAITQNFVSEVGLQAVLAFLKSRRPELVSGCAHENRWGGGAGLHVTWCNGEQYRY